MFCLDAEELVEEFLGIPFSQPPVGENRWQKPRPLSGGWEGTLNGTEYGVHCIQGITDLYTLVGMGGEQSEDCLTINIYRPVQRFNISQCIVQRT